MKSILFFALMLLATRAHAAPLIQSGDLGPNMVFSSSITISLSTQSSPTQGTMTLLNHPICRGFECVYGSTITAYNVANITIDGFAASTSTIYHIFYDCTQLGSDGQPYVQFNKTSGGTGYTPTNIIGTGNNGVASQTIGATDRCYLSYSSAHKTNATEQFAGDFYWAVNPVYTKNGLLFGRLGQSTEGSDVGPGVEVNACRYSLSQNFVTAVTFGTDAGGMECLIKIKGENDVLFPN